MPLRLNVGVSRKIGLPEYSSVGASCNLEVDLDGLHARIRAGCVAPQQAVNDELARLQAQPAPPVAATAAPANGHDRRNGMAPAHGGPARSQGDRGRPSKPATPSQVKAIYA